MTFAMQVQVINCFHKFTRSIEYHRIHSNSWIVKWYAHENFYLIVVARSNIILHAIYLFANTEYSLRLLWSSLRQHEKRVCVWNRCVGVGRLMLWPWHRHTVSLPAIRCLSHTHTHTHICVYNVTVSHYNALIYYLSLHCIIKYFRERKIHYMNLHFEHVRTDYAHRVQYIYIYIDPI